MLENPSGADDAQTKAAKIVRGVTAALLVAGSGLLGLLWAIAPVAPFWVGLTVVGTLVGAAQLWATRTMGLLVSLYVLSSFLLCAFILIATVFWMLFRSGALAHI